MRKINFCKIFYFCSTTSHLLIKMTLTLNLLLLFLTEFCEQLSPARTRARSLQTLKIWCTPLCLRVRITLSAIINIIHVLLLILITISETLIIIFTTILPHASSLLHLSSCARAREHRFLETLKTKTKTKTHISFHQFSPFFFFFYL